MMKHRQLKIFPERKNNESGTEQSNKELVEGEPNPIQSKSSGTGGSKQEVLGALISSKESFRRVKRPARERKPPPRSRGGRS
jgi:hypothetical protein